MKLLNKINRLKKIHQMLRKSFLPKADLATTSVNLDAVRLAYIFLLGREPESAEAVNAHLGLGDIENLRKAIMCSEEFRSKISNIQVRDKSKWVATDVLDEYIIWLDLHDRYVSQGCLNNNWEPEETSFFVSKLQLDDIVLDIGANIGWFSLNAAKHIGPHGKVYSFEPRPETAKMFARTIKHNNLEKIIKLWECALMDKTGTVNLTWENNTDNPGGTFVGRHENSKCSGQQVVSVPAFRLDDLLPDISPNFIKIDVEGAEPLVFSGSRELLSRAKPVILSELHPRQLLKVSNCTPSQYITLMESFGYSCYLLEHGRPGLRLKDFPNTSIDLVSVVFE